MFQQEHDKLDLAYAAGYIDGEGCITCRPYTRQPSSATWRLEIGSCDIEVITFLHQTFGGNVRKIKPTKIAKLQCYNWCLNGQEAYDLLKQLPLRAKASQRDLFCVAFEKYARIPIGLQERKDLIFITNAYLKQEKMRHAIHT